MHNVLYNVYSFPYTLRKLLSVSCISIKSEISISLNLCSTPLPPTHPLSLSNTHTHTHTHTHTPTHTNTHTDTHTHTHVHTHTHTRTHAHTQTHPKVSQGVSVGTPGLRCQHRKAGVAGPQEGTERVMTSRKKREEERRRETGCGEKGRGGEK